VVKGAVENRSIAPLPPTGVTQLVVKRLPNDFLLIFLNPLGIGPVRRAAKQSIILLENSGTSVKHNRGELLGSSPNCAPLNKEQLGVFGFSPMLREHSPHFCICQKIILIFFITKL